VLVRLLKRHKKENKQTNETSEHREARRAPRREGRGKERAAAASGESAWLGIYLTVDPHPPSSGSARITKTQQPNRTKQIRNTARRKRERTEGGALAVFDVADRSERAADDWTLRRGSTPAPGLNENRALLRLKAHKNSRNKSRSGEQMRGVDVRMQLQSQEGLGKLCSQKMMSPSGFLGMDTVHAWTVARTE